MPSSTASTPTSALATRVLEHVARGENEVGHRLTEHALAAAMGVSRTPVRRALREPEELGAVGSNPNRGFFVALPAARLRRLALRAPMPSDDDELYLRIAEERLAGELPEIVFEAQLMERYDTTRLQ